MQAARALALAALLAVATAAAADPGAAALGAAIRNATSDWDELASILAEWFERSAGADAAADLVAFLAVKAVR
jgi:ABC-type proline/glycine betaine transport system substrate-binding protein